MQSVAIFEVAEEALSIRPLICLFALVVFLIPCLVGDSGKIQNITEIIIPLTTIIYIISCFGIIFNNFSRFDDAIGLIIKSAFNLKSATFGISIVAMREGFSRGILSNEAGCGTSAMGHSVSTDRSPHRAGLFAMCEVFFDSSVLCVLTGLAVLVSVEDYSNCFTPMMLIGRAFTLTYGSYSLSVLLLVIFAFAFATIICWFYYGCESAYFCMPLFRPIFPLIFILFIMFSGVIDHRFLLFAIDLILLLMSLLTLSLIVKQSGRISDISRKSRKRKNPEH